MPSLQVDAMFRRFTISNVQNFAEKDKTCGAFPSLAEFRFPSYNHPVLAVHLYAVDPRPQLEA
jgi:hypothetical protein